jgi:protein arginine kinase activator
MQCDHCGEREAEVQLTEIQDGDMKTLHLCNLCAAERGLSNQAAAGTAPLADFLAQIGKSVDEPSAGAPTEPCPYCGTTGSDFRRTGRLGCPQCYPHFERQLRGLLRRIHGSTQHVGKICLSDGLEEENQVTRLADLKRRLQRAVDSEDFESAADLRDEIRALEVEYVE